MWHGWLPLLGELTALAAVVALSPFTVIPAVALVVHSDRPRPVGLAFIAGWLVGKAAITVAFLQVPQLVQKLDGPAPSWTGWVRIGLGGLALVGAVLYWRRSHSSTDSPRWASHIKRITPLSAAATGVILTVINIKVVAACAAAGYLIGSAPLNSAGIAGAVTFFTLVGGSTAAVPILGYAIWTNRIDRFLAAFRDWMQRRQRVLTVIALGLLGGALVYSGASTL
ncbi:GAP family protein [Mycobacterium sp. shizuoka-1]|uniref:GAP family protein n=1 Tax=Mycobacterium sp. shizuoka-1 TaxID=2039281 RepID=UPI000C0636DE|nr:GAP family protein [Mycobacterium sp. shizuoka-1]GAY17947.1 membrane protein [Mycobacterium sp. shizuoka-1]